MAYAQLRKQRVDGSDLYSGSPAGISQFGRSNVILALRLQQRKCCESFDDTGAGPGAREPLQELLQHEACRDNDLCAQ